jgi:transcriptional regulator with XRE-family HTH domain
MLSLVGRLDAIQTAHKWSDVEMAGQLGITRVMWQQVHHGDRRLGAKTLRAIVRTFPELGPEVLAYLAEDGAEPEPTAA